MFGDQTDVPESGDWWDATYLMMWGSNVPVTRTPDAHWMAEVRYRGTKVVTVSPDYADNTKFADEWMPAQAGTDAALAMAMGHVLLKEFFVRPRGRRSSPTTCAPTPTCRSSSAWSRTDDDALRAGQVPHRRRPAAEARRPRTPGRRSCSTRRPGQPVVPNGSMGFRYADSGKGRWNLDLEGVTPALTMTGDGAEAIEVLLPAFDAPDGTGSCCGAGCPPARSAATSSRPSST